MPAFFCLSALLLWLLCSSQELSSLHLCLFVSNFSHMEPSCKLQRHIHLKAQIFLFMARYQSTSRKAVPGPSEHMPAFSQSTVHKL